MAGSSLLDGVGLSVFTNRDMSSIMLERMPARWGSAGGEGLEVWQRWATVRIDAMSSGERPSIAFRGERFLFGVIGVKMLPDQQLEVHAVAEGDLC